MPYGTVDVTRIHVVVRQFSLMAALYDKLNSGKVRF